MNVFQGNQQQNDFFSGIENLDVKRQAAERDLIYKQESQQATEEGTRNLAEGVGESLNYGKFNSQTQTGIGMSAAERAERREEEANLPDLGNLDDTARTPLVSEKEHQNTGSEEAKQPQNNSEITEGDYNVVKKTPEENKEIPIQVDHIEDSPFTPKLKQLVKNGLLEVDQVQNFYNKIKGKTGNEQKQEFMSFIENKLPDSEVLKVFPEKKEVTRENFSGTDFATDAAGYQLDFPEQTTGLEVLLAENYSPIGTKEGTQDIQSDIKISIETTVNSIITNNNDDFKKKNIGIINKIRTATNIHEQYGLLQDLYKADLIKDAHHFGVKDKASIIEQELDLKREYKEKHVELEVAQEANDNVVIKKLQLEIEKLEEKANKLDKLDRDFHLVEGELAKSEGDVYKTSEKPSQGAEG